jgi:hypothetical protein
MGDNFFLNKKIILNFKIQLKISTIPFTIVLSLRSRVTRLGEFGHSKLPGSTWS